MFPCCYCEVSKNNLESIATLRTIESCKKNYNNWCDSGSLKQEAKNYFSCVNPPICSKNTYNTLSDVIIPPELPMIGIVNHIVEHMMKYTKKDTLF